MTTNQIRAAFLEYFERQDHLRLPSASLVPFEDDPSVLLTIAGMQPLKQYFLGSGRPPAPRMTSSQKCFRTVDIDQVGRTARHLTFFEMLGNFSIGDYFKDDAIRFGWEVSTEVFGLDPERIWITVFEGMEGVPGDDEALARWIEIGVPAERIQRLGEADNFWKAGPTGPCGPNTELYVDRGPSYGPEGGPVTGGDRYLEYWNLVFMQYDRGADGSLSPLPARNIDTGAGLERLAAILQGVDSVFETDAFRPLVEWGERASGRRYGRDSRDDRALRVLADHGRAMTFLAADGVRPGNEGRDYVLRRVIRRAVNEARHIGIAAESLTDLVSPVVEGWSAAYPELRAQADEVRGVIHDESLQFARTLAQGRRILRQVIEDSRTSGQVSGQDAFRLYATYGFPLDLTIEAAEDACLSVDVSGFEGERVHQRMDSQLAAPMGRRTMMAEHTGPFGKLVDPPDTDFAGYENHSLSDTQVLDVQPRGGEYFTRLTRSPFYQAGGGQVDDTGWLEGPDGTAEVVGLSDIGRQILRIRVLQGQINPGDHVRAIVDARRRRRIQANHTATHLLHWALRERLGSSVRQAGSYVGPDKLRFDFTHRGRLSETELSDIERAVNEKIDDAVDVEWRVMPRHLAAGEGAIGLFEEKYGEEVRVVSVGDFSKELCGGTHVRNTEEIGGFVITAETSVGSGARRIEAVTGVETVRWLRLREGEFRQELEAQEGRLKQLQTELRRAKDARSDIGDLGKRAVQSGSVSLLVEQVEATDMDDLLRISDRVKGSLGDGAAVVLGAASDGKALIVANLAPGAVAAGLSAGDLIREVAPIVGGGGGGKPQMARAGGKDPARLPEALEAARAILTAAPRGA